jgi:AP-1 complex subunit gamma-1
MTKIVARFNNKTSSFIDQLNLQTAVLKYLKIVIHPLNGNSLSPKSKGEATQQMEVTNSMLGQKPIVMKIKLGYTVNGQKESFEEKIEGFPNGF